MIKIPEKLIGRWISEYSPDDCITVTENMFVWKHYDDEPVDFLDEKELIRRYSGTFEYTSHYNSLCVIFSDVINDEGDLISGYYLFQIDGYDNLHMYYLFQQGETEKLTGKEEYIYMRFR